MILFLSLIDDEYEKIKFKDIYNTYKKMMFYIAQKILKDEHDAHDAVQESFFKIIRNIDKINDINSLKTKGFICIIVKNTSIDIYRKLKRKNEREVLYEDESLFETESYEYDEIEMANEIEMGILKLPEKYKSVFLLKYSQGLSNKEIGNLLDIKESTVRIRILRGKEKLKEILEQMGVAVNE
ncbi:MAG: RNA polymerase sigma factor [Terrisporobacter sp.]